VDGTDLRRSWRHRRDDQGATPALMTMFTDSPTFYAGADT
jgi:hypothetical protein